jgi:translocation and assembly module TamB
MNDPPTQSGASRRNRGRGLKIALAIVALVAVAIAAFIGWGVSERGLSFIAAEIGARSAGRVSVEGASGSIAGTMRFARVTWRGVDATVIADDVVVDWNPGALLGKRLSIHGLGARHVDIAVKPSTGGTTNPPTNLQLPWAIDIDRLAIGRLEWHAGPRSGNVSGLELGYAGDATRHAIRDLALISEFGRLTGNIELGAREPLAVSGTAALDGDGPLAGGHASVTLEGPLARISVAAKGAFHDATLSLQAVATPFATTPFASATAELTGVDAASFDASLPQTDARVHLAFAPQGDGIAGTLDIANAMPGPIDNGRFPVARLASTFSLDKDALRLQAIDATLADGGGARGDGLIALGDPQRSVRFALTVTNVNLARLDTKLVTTRLSGKVTADANAARQAIEGDVRDRDMTLAFAAAIANGRVDVAQFRASAGGGSLTGSARMALDDRNDFSVQATMERLDPSRFAAVPAASLDGTLKASGALHPRWQAAAELHIAPTSRYSGIALSGNAKGAAAPGTVSGLDVDVLLGSARLNATGAAGSPGDRLAITVDAPRLAEVATLLPSAVPQPLAGSLHARGPLALGNGPLGGDVEWHVAALHAGPYAAATLQGRAAIAPAASTRAALDSRALSFDVEATQLALGARKLDALHATATGSIARHHATVALRGSDIDATLALDGSLRNAEDIANASWAGTLVELENRGTIPVRLRDSASLSLRRGYARVADAHIEAADGRADVGEFVWNEGRITTRGAFTGIPLATAARLAGTPLPVESTLVLGGDWSIAATPRLTGRFSIQRERGDILADVPSGTSTRREGVGITMLTIAGTFHDDALDARGSFASARAGTLNGTLAIGTVTGVASGKIDASAPLRLAVRASLPSLAVFQPWFGTEAAINGRAELDVGAGGTVGKPLWSGALAGEALQIDAPAYGMHVSDGRLRAHLTSDGIALDGLHFAGGDGTFDASGVIAIPGEGKRATTNVGWKASRFRIANRPDLRFTVDGNGSIALENRRLALHGNVTVVEGHVEYEASPTGKLASDIVIKGAPAPRDETGPRNVPVALDVEVDLGRDLTFVGEGLDARLTGRVHVTTNANGRLQASGTIRAVNGTYVAFGQKLTIDRGRVIFDGPLDNPALDVVALRKNLPVEAGVELTGTVKVPQVRITSSPPVPENEALAWLVTGQGLNGTGRVDYAALSAASAALLGRKGKPFTAGIAQRFGLDEISLQSSGATSAQGTVSQVVVLGKRISDRLSLGYEQGLSLASSALRLEYALSRQVTLRAEAGTVSGVSIVYRRSFR